MANRAYLRVWTRDFSEQTMIAEFARFLTTVPLAETRSGFDQLIVQAIEAGETPLEEWDLREQKYGPAEVAALAIQHLNADTAYLRQRQMGFVDLRHRNAEMDSGPATARTGLPRRTL